MKTGEELSAERRPQVFHVERSRERIALCAVTAPHFNVDGSRISGEAADRHRPVASNNFGAVGEAGRVSAGEIDAADRAAGGREGDEGGVAATLLLW